MMCDLMRLGLPLVLDRVTKQGCTYRLTAPSLSVEQVWSLVQIVRQPYRIHLADNTIIITNNYGRTSNNDA